MDNLQEILEDFGLSPDEAKVYLAMLIKDQTTVLKISDETEIKRSTVYLILDRLITKNLARVAIMGKKKYYFAVNPKALLENLDKKRKELEEIIPLLKEQYKTHIEKPKVTFYEGREGVEQVYEEIALSESKGEFLWFSSQQEMMEEFYSSHIKLEKPYFPPGYRGVRMIVNPTKIDREYAQSIMANKQYKNFVKARILPKNLLFMHTDNCIYDNKLIIFSIKKDYFAIVIESMDIANTYRAIFELAWDSAIKIN